MENPNIVVIGGGSGTSNLLRELKVHTEELSAVVNMSDDGGSSGVLSRERGVMPPGDVRQCLSALSESPIMASVFERRIMFEGVDHAIGNLILANAEENYGSFAEAVRISERDLRVKGRVLPVTLQHHELLLRDGNEVVRGESNIAHHAFITDRPALDYSPLVYLAQEAERALGRADIVTIAPGHPHGSVLPALGVAGVAEALADSDAKVVMVANLASIEGQTEGWHVAEHVAEVERYIGEDRVDTVIYNVAAPDSETLKRYWSKNQQLLKVNDAGFRAVSARAVAGHLLGQCSEISSSGGLVRNRLRHDAQEVGRILLQQL